VQRRHGQLSKGMDYHIIIIVIITGL